MIHEILKDTTLRKVGGEWTLSYQGKEYMRLLDATSREDAEQQILEMLFVRAYGHVMPPPAQPRAVTDGLDRQSHSHNRQFFLVYDSNSPTTSESLKG